MVGELKVLGFDYQPHVLCGSLERGERIVGEQSHYLHIQRSPEAGWHPGYFNTLEGAYRRLLAFKQAFYRIHQKSVEAWLLLVLDTRCHMKNERLAKQLALVDFSDEEYFDFKTGWPESVIRVRGWRLNDQGPH